MRMRRIILLSVASMALQYFSTFSHTRHDFRGKKLLNKKKCVLIFSTTFVCYISRSMKNWARYDQKSLLVLHLSACPSCQIFMKLEFSRQSFEVCSNTKLPVNPSIGSRATACGQTDMTKLTVAFRNFTNAPKNRWCRRKVENTGIMVEQLMCNVSSQLTTHLIFNVLADKWGKLFCTDISMQHVTFDSANPQTFSINEIREEFLLRSFSHTLHTLCSGFKQNISDI